MKAFIPHKLPLEKLNFKNLLSLVGSANAELARYDSLLQGRLDKLPVEHVFKHNSL